MNSYLEACETDSEPMPSLHMHNKPMPAVHVHNKPLFASLSVRVLKFWPRVYKTFFHINSAEHEIYPAHKC